MKKLLAVILGLTALCLMTSNVALATNDDEKKVIVCKYVGTPGVDERLQIGNNPISVSVNALGSGFTGTFPYEFNDAQGRSVAIRYAIGNEQGDISECPGVNNPPPPPPPERGECPEGYTAQPSENNKVLLCLKETVREVPGPTVTVTQTVYVDRPVTVEKIVEKLVPVEKIVEKPVVQVVTKTKTKVVYKIKYKTKTKTIVKRVIVKVVPKPRTAPRTT